MSIVSPQNFEFEGTTRKRLLHATEYLFASHGFSGLTMRGVAEKANTNIASAHYHFGSKEAMVLEMLRKRIEPLNALRLMKLEEEKTKVGNEALPTRVVFSALISPIGELVSRDSESLIMNQLVARSFTEPVSFIEKMQRRFFKQLATIFISELKNSHPQANEEDIHWNFHLAISAMLGALAQHRRLKDFSNGICDDKDFKGMINRLICFTSSGFDAGISEFQ